MHLRREVLAMSFWHKDTLLGFVEGQLFTDSTMVNHHEKPPPFGRNIVLFFCPTTLSNSKIDACFLYLGLLRCDPFTSKPACFFFFEKLLRPSTRWAPSLVITGVGQI